MKNILVACDGGEPAHRALETGVELAKRFDASLADDGPDLGLPGDRLRPRVHRAVLAPANRPDAAVVSHRSRGAPAASGLKEPEKGTES